MSYSYHGFYYVLKKQVILLHPVQGNEWRAIRNKTLNDLMVLKNNSLIKMFSLIYKTEFLPISLEACPIII